MNRIDKLERKLERQTNRINVLKGKITLQRNVLDQLEIRCVDNQQSADVPVFEFMELQYLRIKSNDNLLAVVKSCHGEIKVTFDQDNIDRVHRVGKKCTDENTGKKLQSIIV